MPAASSRSEIDAFLGKVNALQPRAADAGKGRLIFAMDATQSRQPTWDLAQSLQADMFDSVAATGGLDVQLVYFRGFNEAQASHWVADPRALARVMAKVGSRGGRTQIGRVLSHALNEHTQKPVHALVFIGDAMEEGADELSHRAGEMGLRHLPVFMFQEGRDGDTAAAFREIARLSGGAYCAFDQGAAAELRALLAAVAAYAAGGRKALLALGREAAAGAGARALLQQLAP